MYYQVERYLYEWKGSPAWCATDFRVYGNTIVDAEEECQRISEKAGWIARVGKPVGASSRYSDFVWLLVD